MSGGQLLNDMALDLSLSTHEVNEFGLGHQLGAASLPAFFKPRLAAGFDPV
jgi:hypothetical protein